MRFVFAMTSELSSGVGSILRGVSFAWLASSVLAGGSLPTETTLLSFTPLATQPLSFFSFFGDYSG
jgi:hypothetical protein